MMHACCEAATGLWWKSQVAKDYLATGALTGQPFLAIGLLTDADLLRRNLPG